MFGILELWNNNRVTPSLSKLHELSYRSNTPNSLTVADFDKQKIYTELI